MLTKTNINSTQRKVFLQGKHCRQLLPTLDIFFFVYVLASPTTGIGGGDARAPQTF